MGVMLQERNTDAITALGESRLANLWTNKLKEEKLVYFDVDE